MRFQLFVGAITLASLSQAGLVTNGDFEAGNSGFSSGYTYVAPGGGNLVPPAVYTVDTNANNSHSAFASYGDHTTGQGLYMIVNGDTTSGTTVWEASTNAALVMGQQYTFSAYISNAHPASPATLDLQVDGNSVAMGSPTGLGAWSLISGSFTASANSTALLSIVNSNPAFTGNDFAIDDISVEAVPEPATMAVLGLGLAAAARRRRK